MITQLATSVHEGIILARQTGENATKSMHRKNYEGALNTMENQQSGLKKTEETADRMVVAAKKCDETLGENQKTFDRWETAIKKMDEKIEGLMKKNDDLERNWTTWQTASDFVDDLATYIYPPDTKVTFGPKFTKLMLWLQQNQNTSEGEEANKKWNDLQRKAKFQWTDDHKNLLETMLRCKNIGCNVSFNNEDIRRREEILRMNQFLQYAVTRA